MGIGLWLAVGVAAYFLARIVPHGRTPARIGELVLAIVTALLLGVLATALDFGGWKEADWRAAVFAFLGAFAAVGALRAVRS